MESSYQQLIQNLAEVNKALRATAPDDINPPEKDNPVPAIETIDFDKLSGLLQETVVSLNHAREQQREHEIAREWFVRRIESFRKARQAILSEKRLSNSGNSLNKATLPELIRLFEEASNALRGLARDRGGRRYKGKFGKDDEVRQFKS